MIMRKYIIADTAIRTKTEGDPSNIVLKGDRSNVILEGYRRNVVPFLLTLIPLIVSAFG